MPTVKNIYLYEKTTHGQKYFVCSRIISILLAYYHNKHEIIKIQLKEEKKTHTNELRELQKSALQEIMSLNLFGLFDTSLAFTYFSRKKM